MLLLCLVFLLVPTLGQIQSVGTAHIVAQGASGVTGTVVFHQNTDSTVTVTVSLVGLGTRTSAAIHVHTFGDLTSTGLAMDGLSAGGHYVGNGSATHGCPGNATRHEGDMGTWSVVSGNINQTKSLDIMSFISILGRAVVVHDLADTCTGAVGNAGSRIGFGVIGISDSTPAGDTSISSATGLTSLVAVMSATANCPFSDCTGYVWLSQTATGISAVAHFPGIMDGKAHGLHIHQFGNIADSTGASVGKHWNPLGATHALPGTPGHAGDLGNLQNYHTTGAWYSYMIPNSTSYGLNDMVGRALVLHFDKDHGNGASCDASGSSGARIAFGVLGIQNSNASLTISPTLPQGLVIDNTQLAEDCSSLATLEAVSNIYGQGGQTIYGTVRFSQTSASGLVLVTINLSGLGTLTQVGIHVHMFGDMTSQFLAQDGASTGGHYVGAGAAVHGCPGTTNRHAGDMGTWQVTSGQVSQSKMLDLITLTGTNSIIGRAVVVHTAPDGCIPTAVLGARIAFGVIGVASPAPSPYPLSSPTPPPSAPAPPPSTSTPPTNTAGNGALGITSLVAIMENTQFCPGDCSGMVWFSQTTLGGPITVTGTWSVNDGKQHGLHIHTYGDLTVDPSTGIPNTGAHWNPGNSKHGFPNTAAGTYHFGDLGNAGVYSNGKLYSELTISSPPFTLNELVGLGLILHLDQDHGAGASCDASGSSGKRIAAGVIGIQNTNSSLTLSPSVPSGLQFPSTWANVDCTTSIAEAVAVIVAQSVTDTQGFVTFTEYTDHVDVYVEVHGLGARTSVGIHIHEFGDLTALAQTNTGLSAGGHYIGQGSSTHGCENTTTRHEGDMGAWPVIAGSVQFTKSLNLLTLRGPNSILGRAVVVHNETDDCMGATGNAGSRIGFGVIGLVNSTVPPAYTLAPNGTTLVAALQSTDACLAANCDGFLWIQEDPSNPDMVIVTANFPTIISVGGNSKDSHGLHIHTFGDLRGFNASTVGGHWNPGNNTHGLPPSMNRHAGDLGMVSGFLVQDGWYQYNFSASILPISSLLGRAVVLHALPDNGAGAGCDASGSSGARVSVGVIGYQNPTSGQTLNPEVPAGMIFPTGWTDSPCEASQDEGSGGGVPWWGWVILVFCLCGLGIFIGIFFYFYMSGSGESAEYV